MKGLKALWQLLRNIDIFELIALLQAAKVGFEMVKEFRQQIKDAVEEGTAKSKAQIEVSLARDIAVTLEDVKRKLIEDLVFQNKEIRSIVGDEIKQLKTDAQTELEKFKKEYAIVENSLTRKIKNLGDEKAVNEKIEDMTVQLGKRMDSIIKQSVDLTSGLKKDVISSLEIAQSSISNMVDVTGDLQNKVSSLDVALTTLKRAKK